MPCSHARQCAAAGAAALLLLSATAAADTLVAYVSTLTEDSIVRLVDLNGDGDYHDAGEATQFFGPGNADGWPGVGSAQCILVLGPDDLLAGDGEEAGAFDTRVYRLRDLNGDGDAMDAGEATEFWNSILPIGVNFDRPKEITIGPDGAFYLADNNTINFDNDTPEAVWRLADLNNDGDVNDPGEVTLYKELAPVGSAFGFICEDFKWNSAGELVFSNAESSSNDDMIWIIKTDLSLQPYASDNDLLGIGYGKVGMTLDPLTENPVMAAFDIFDVRRIEELADLNGNGRIDDLNESINRYRSDVAAEPILWNYQGSNVFDVDFAPDGSLWLLNNVNDLIIRFVDLNDDRDFNDANEAAIIYAGATAAANGAFEITFPRTVGFAVIAAGPAGDLSGDNCVDFDDFAILSANWGPGNAGGDTNGDANTDFDDFAQLSADWGAGCP